MMGAMTKKVAGSFLRRIALTLIPLALLIPSTLLVYLIYFKLRWYLSNIEYYRSGIPEPDFFMVNKFHGVVLPIAILISLNLLLSLISSLFIKNRAYTKYVIALHTTMYALAFAAGILLGFF